MGLRLIVSHIPMIFFSILYKDDFPIEASIADGPQGRMGSDGHFNLPIDQTPFQYWLLTNHMNLTNAVTMLEQRKSPRYGEITWEK